MRDIYYRENIKTAVSDYKYDTLKKITLLIYHFGEWLCMALDSESAL